MIVRKMEMREVDVIAECRCDRCGDDMMDNQRGITGAFAVSVMGGYFSKHMGDGDHYEFSACEKCLLEWFAGFKHDPCTNPEWRDGTSEADDQ